MKRVGIIIVFAMCVIGAMQAQVGVYRSSGYGAIQKEKKQRPKREYEWENFLLANYNFGVLHNTSQYRHSFGITYGRVKLFGWYVNATAGTGTHYGYSYQADDYEGRIDFVYPFYTGKSSYNRLSLTAGGIVRMVIPLYLYLGLGYGYVSTTREISDGKWVMMSQVSSQTLGHSMSWDLGLQGNIKGFTISVGYSVLTEYVDGALQEAKISLGYTFKDKKK